MAGNLSVDDSAVLLEGVTSILEAVENGSGGRVRLCETAAAMFACGAVGHAWLDPVHHGWSLCLWRRGADGARTLTLTGVEVQLTGDVLGTWWPESSCRRLALDWLASCYRAELPLAPVVHPSCSVLLLGRDRVFRPADVGHVAAVLRRIAVVERTVLRLESPVWPAPQPAVHVTEREVQVLRLLSDGLIARSIAHRMSVSERTVHKHLENLYQKLGVHDRLTAVIRGQQLGLLPGQPVQQLGLLPDRPVPRPLAALPAT